MKFSISDISAEMQIAIKSMSLPVAKAATIAITNAGDLLRTTARAQIASAGFSKKWQNAYKVTVYPQRGFSISPAAFGLFKGISFSDIFGLGGRIIGKPFLWLPFKTTPKIDRRKSEPDVADFQKRGIKLFSIGGAARPILAAPVLMSHSQAGKRIVKVTLGDIESGVKKTRVSKRHPGLVSRMVPLFFGIPTVTIKKRFNWPAVEVAVQSKVPALYEQAINQLADK